MLLMKICIGAYAAIEVRELSNLTMEYILDIYLGIV